MTDRQDRQTDRTDRILKLQTGRQDKHNSEITDKQTLISYLY